CVERNTLIVEINTEDVEMNPSNGGTSPFNIEISPLIVENYPRLSTLCILGSTLHPKISMPFPSSIEMYTHISTLRGSCVARHRHSSTPHSCNVEE
ncbi:MAG: hypothetical protein ACJ759_08315, partial [Thermoanaerobaculia bacterium]